MTKEGVQPQNPPPKSANETCIDLLLFGSTGKTIQFCKSPPGVQTNANLHGQRILNLQEDFTKN